MISSSSPAARRRSTARRPAQLITTAAFLAFQTAPALAQIRPVQPAPTSTADPSPQQSGPATKVDDVTVVGERLAATSAIDRRTYRVDSDLQAASGSVSDVLRNLPSVEVDANGVVSLRGDANVQILIDGMPSTSLTPALRADTLQQLGADTVDSIEVITNPSAAFRPDGASGVINIITRKNRAPGTSGSVRGSAGTDGRYSLGVSATSHHGAVTLSGNLGLRQDQRRRALSDDRTRTDPLTGQVTRSRQESISDTARLSRIVGAGIDYDATAHDRLSASVSYNDRTGNLDVNQRNTVADAAATLVSDYDRIGVGDETQVSTEAQAKYRHGFAEEEREFTLELRRGRTDEDQYRRFTNTYRTPVGPDRIEEQNPRETEIEDQLTAQYVHPLANGKIESGYDVLREYARYRNSGGVIDASGVSIPDPALTSQFIYERTVHALYTTWERPLGRDWSAILGLRLEQAFTDAYQINLGQRNTSRYFRAYPTLHLQYDLSDTQSLRFSYSQRVQRPEAEVLNPFPTFSDPLNVRAGNPDLQPSRTRSYEAGYLYQAGGTSWEATLFLRQTSDAFTDVSRFISPTVVLTTPENLGRNTAAGLDVSGRGKLSEALSYRLSGTVNYVRLDPGDLAFEVRSGVNYSAKAGMDYRITASDLFQISAEYRGRRQTVQGYRSPVGGVNLGYRHSFANGVAAVLTVSDLFDSQSERNYIDSGAFQGVSVRRNSRRLLNLALTFPFGGQRVADEAPAVLSD